MKAALTYWGCAVLVALALQWPPLWVIVAAVVGKVCWQGYKAKRARMIAKRLPIQAATASVSAEAAFPSKKLADEAKPPEQEIPLAEGQLYDPFVVAPEVYRFHIDWRRYEVPTFQRKQLTLPETATVGPVFDELPTDPTQEEPSFSATPDTAENETAGGNFSYC